MKKGHGGVKPSNANVVAIGPNAGPLSRSEAVRAARHALDVVLASACQRGESDDLTHKNVASLRRFAADMAGVIRDAANATAASTPISPGARVTVADSAFAIERLSVEITDFLCYWRGMYASLEVLVDALRPLVPELGDPEIPWERLSVERRTELFATEVTCAEESGWVFDNAPEVEGRRGGR